MQRLPTTPDDDGRDATRQALKQAALGQLGSKGRGKAEALLMGELAQPAVLEHAAEASSLSLSLSLTLIFAPAQRLAEGEPSESARAEQVDPFEDRERVGEREEDEGEVEAQPGRSADLPRVKGAGVMGCPAGSARRPPLGV